NPRRAPPCEMVPASTIPAPRGHCDGVDHNCFIPACTPSTTAAGCVIPIPNENTRRTPSGLRPPLAGADVPRRRGASGAPRPERHPALRPPEHQDGRLPGGLRLLLAERPLRHPRPADPPDERGRGEGAGGAGEATRGDAFLHGSGLAWPTRRPELRQ